MPRMRILNTVEQEQFDHPPELSSMERKKYFGFPRQIEDNASALRTPLNQVCYLLTCGYFRAARKFFPPTSYRARDIAYVARRLGVEVSEIDLSRYSKESRRRHRAMILEFYGFREFRAAGKPILAAEIEEMVLSQLHPRLILYRCRDQLIERKVEVPTCNALSAMILSAVNRRKQHLSRTIASLLDLKTRALLDALLQREDEDSPTAAYRLTLLKKHSQSTKPSKVKERIEDLLCLRELFAVCEPILAGLGLNHEGVRYYASAVIKSEIFQVSRRTPSNRYLHLIAFVAHQFRRLQDNLIDVLLSVSQSCINTVKREHKEHCYTRRNQRTDAIRELFSRLDENLLGVLSEVQRIAEDADLGNDDKVSNIRSLLQSRKDDRAQLEACMNPIREDLEAETSGVDYWAIMESKSVRLQNRLGLIVRSLDFQGETRTLLEAISYYKTHDGAIDKRAPVAFLDERQVNAVASQGRFRGSLYKVFLFLEIRNAIKSGTLNLSHSYKYRPLDDYLISRQRWQNERATLLERAGLQDFERHRTVLGDLRDVLHRQYRETNGRIADGGNEHVRVANDGTIRVHTPRQTDTGAIPLRSLFPERHYVSLLEILATTNRYCGFVDELEHWRTRYRRSRPPVKTFLAGAIALGCGIGTHRIARISRAISESQLENTVNWYFSRENIEAANDRILQMIDRLELPDVYRQGEQLHTSSDGQQFEVHGDSLNANYSYKYGSKAKGSSVYSFIDERHLLFHSNVISAAERESAYVIDGLMHNNVVRSDIHSTDTAGYSEIIFGVMHLLGVSFAPRIKNLKKQRLYSFKEMDRDKGWAVTPVRSVDVQLVKRHWDDILRFVATIRLKEATASELFRRLNSYSKQHSLYRALKAFGQVIKSVFILRFIDDVRLRQAIERQLNKIESSHRLSRAITVQSPREMADTDKQEQEIAEGCSRLIKNAIVCWNYMYLSQKLANADPETREELRLAVAHGSVVSWYHINLLGEYDFSDERMEDTVGIRPPKLAA